MNKNDIYELIKNSNIAEVIFPSELPDSMREVVLLGYAQLFEKVLYNLTDRDITVINKLYIKGQDMILIPQCQLFLQHISNLIITDILINNIDGNLVSIDVLYTNMKIVLNNLARESILPINLEMDSTIFSLFRKHIYAMTELSLSTADMIDYRKSMSSLIDWITLYPHEYRRAINNLRTTSLKITIPNEGVNTIRDELGIRLLNEELLRRNVDVKMVEMLNNLLVYHSFWMNIPENRMLLKISRRLGRYISRLWGNIIRNEFRLD